jgi:hypothetical protein
MLETHFMKTNMNYGVVIELKKLKRGNLEEAIATSRAPPSHAPTLFAECGCECRWRWFLQVALALRFQ